MVDDLPLLGGVGLVAADLYRRVLGKSVDEVGIALSRWTEYRLRNVGRVVENAAEKLGEEDGEVPMRVAMRVFEEASYADDDVIVEYLGGVLASAHTPVGRDDRGAAWASLLRSMSAYQLRAHFLVYREVRRLYLGQPPETYRDELKCGVFLPWPDFERAMDFSADEDGPGLAEHAMSGLFRNDLVLNPEVSPDRDGYEWYRGKLDVLGGGVVTIVTDQGAELYMWAHGLGSGTRFDDLFSPAQRMESGTLDIAPTMGARALKDISLRRMPPGGRQLMPLCRLGGTEGCWGQPASLGCGGSCIDGRNSRSRGLPSRFTDRPSRPSYGADHVLPRDLEACPVGVA